MNDQVGFLITDLHKSDKLIIRFDGASPFCHIRTIRQFRCAEWNVSWNISKKCEWKFSPTSAGHLSRTDIPHVPATSLISLFTFFCKKKNCSLPILIPHQWGQLCREMCWSRNVSLHKKAGSNRVSKFLTSPTGSCLSMRLK